MAEEDTEQNRTKIAKASMLQALRQSLGIVTPALEKADIGRTTYYQWLQDDKEFSDAVNVMGEISLDHTESKLLKCINDNKEKSIHFHLERKGKARGYGAKMEVDTTIKPGTGRVIILPHNGRDDKSMTAEPVKSVEYDWGRRETG